MLLAMVASLVPGLAEANPARLTVRAAAPRVRAAAAATGTTLIAEGFSTNTTVNAWVGSGGACLTASATVTPPAGALPGCGKNAPLDASGQGALQLTANAASVKGMAIASTPLSTANGLQVTFTDYAFNGSATAGDGLAFFFTDAAKPIPAASVRAGDTMGYAGSATAPGLSNAYVGIALDEYGGFSSPTGLNGGPGRVPETVTVRGAAATTWQYLGGVTNASGAAVSLPFAIDAPTQSTRPTNAPTIRATLLPSGALSVALDHHDGNGFVTYYSKSIVGVGGQPAVPAKVYFGMTAATGGSYNRHQVSGVVVSALAAPVPGALLTESFTAAATTNTWTSAGGACLTAGTAATPATSPPACGANAPLDAAGAGALQLTSTAGSVHGMAISKTPLPTANGLQVTFTDYAFNGTTPGADGMAFFFTDASKPIPGQTTLAGGTMGYSGTAAAPGLANAYLGVALDEYGGFSATEAQTGGPGRTAESIAARGAAATLWQYLGGATTAAGVPASLPFALDSPTSVTRPANAPTVRAILSPSGVISVALDHHDGNGFATYYSQSIVGVGGQPAVPANVYFGLTAGSGGLHNRHQVANLTIASANLPPAVSAAQNPPALISANGSLVFNVTAQANATTGNPQFVYNGSTVPPTLRVLPGDTLVVNLTNNLPTPPAGSGFTNNTNLHYHGLHVSPLAPGDDSIDMLAAPGQSLHYSVQIPVNHPPGLYWYHAHAHGEAERQTLSGMSGALIVDGIAAYTPQVANMTERVLVVRDTPLAGATLPNADLHQVYAMKWAMQHGVGMHALSHGVAHTSGNLAEYHASSSRQTRNPYLQSDPRYRRFVRPLDTSPHCVAGSPEAAAHGLTLNGQTQPALAIAPGEQQFWRLVNAGADTYLDVQVDNTQMTIVGLDGVPLSSGVGAPATMTVSHWVLPPASRVEFIVTGPPVGTTAYLRTNCFDSGPAGIAMPATILASISPTGTANARTANRAVARISPRAQRYRFHTTGTKGRIRSVAGIRAATVSTTRTIYYSDQNTIDGAAYDPAAPPMFYAQTGTVEEWTIVNNATQVHTFHIHQVHFVVEAINGTTQSPQFVMDNVNVPAATSSGPGSVKLLLDFTDPTVIGTFLLHCHILSHEDAGMMAKIRIGTAAPLVLSASSVNFTSPTAAMQSVTVTGGATPFSVTGCAGVATAAVSGNTISLLPTAGGACVLTLADASNPSITASISIAVSSAAAVVSLAPSTVSFTSPTAAAQQVKISGGTAPYSLAGCTQIATGAIAQQTLTIAPQSTGACSLIVSDANNNTATLSVSVNSVTTGNGLDNLTFHGNPQRTGWYQNESVLTTANVGSTNFGRVATLAPPSGMLPLGKVYAQPLFVTNETAVDGNTHNLIVVSGSAGQMYAFDETTLAVVWHRSFTNTAAGIRQQLWSDTNCSDVNPDVGLIGTPVIDRTRDAIYVVVATMENGVPYTRLHAIGLGTGTDLVTPTVISGSVTLVTGGTASISSLGNMNRSALLEANGNIYVALGSHCDQNTANIHGWIAAYSASTLQETGSLVDLSNANDGRNYYLGSPWMAGFGPASDAQGNVYFATGNGPFNGTTDFSMSVLKVPGTLNLAAASYFAPITATADGNADQDLGSGGVLLLPDQTGSLPHLLVAGGKCSVNSVGCLKYILNRDALGGQQTGNAGAVWSGSTAGGIWGGPAYFADATGQQHIVYGANPLNTYNLSVSPSALTVQSSTTGVTCLECRDAGSQPVVSSNGTQAGTAIVWALKTPGNGGGTISLYAFNALNMGTTLFTGAAGTWTQATGTSYIGGALVSPLVVDGRVYVPTDGSVGVFGLLH